MAGVSGINAVGSVAGSVQSQQKSTESGTSFSSILKDAMDQTESLNTQSNQDLFNLLSGNTDDLAGLMVDSQKADVAVSLTAAIRNKAMDAYKEVMNMQV